MKYKCIKLENNFEQTKIVTIDFVKNYTFTIYFNILFIFLKKLIILKVNRWIFYFKNLLYVLNLYYFAFLFS